jgi:hypothetical protein
MLLLSRHPGEWIEVTHRSGDVLRIYLSSVYVHGPHARARGADLGFEDAARNFEIARVRPIQIVGFLPERPVLDPPTGDGR